MYETWELPKRTDSAMRTWSVRYAAPATGSRRFSPPEQLTGTLAEQPSATNEARISPLQEPGDPTHPICLGDREMTDDVLMLNIWSPANPDGSPLPIAVYIHGGNLIHGAAGWPIYDGAELAQTTNAVVVTVGYRLGIWGWDTEMPWSTNDTSAGMLDQTAALEWVAEHAAEFGGDASRIALMGHSVGAACALLHVYGGSSIVSRLAVFSPPLDGMRTKERAEFAGSFAAQDSTASLLGDQPERADNAELLEFQNALESAWRKADNSDDLLGFARPVLPGLDCYPWERNEAPSSSVPVFSTWTDGEFGERGPAHEERLTRLLAARTSSDDVHARLSTTGFEGISVGDTHFMLIPLIFGNHEAWSTTSLSGFLNEPTFVARQTELRSSLAAFIHA